MVAMDMFPPPTPSHQSNPNRDLRSKSRKKKIKIFKKIGSTRHQVTHLNASHDGPHEVWNNEVVPKVDEPHFHIGTRLVHWTPHEHTRTYKSTHTEVKSLVHTMNEKSHAIFKLNAPSIIDPPLTSPPNTHITMKIPNATLLE